MATFVYEAFTKSGEAASGTVDATDEVEARNQLKQQGLLVLEVRQSRAAGLGRAEIRLGGEKVKMKDVAWAARNLATTQAAGLPIVRALKMLGSQRQKDPIGKTLLRVHESVVNGAALGDAFAAEEAKLGQLTTALISAGETSGKLDVSMAKLADLCEARVRLKRKIMSAMAYPAVMIGLVVLIFLAMLLFVVPTFKGMYAQLGGDLPALTAFLIDASETAQAYWWLFPLLGTAGVLGVKQVSRNPKLRRRKDEVVLKLPLFGSLLRSTAVARLATTLASTLGAGVPLLDALSQAGNVANNAVFKEALEAVRSEVREGKSLATALAAQPVIPDIFTQLVAIGEETGAVDDLMVKYAKTVEDEVETKVEGLTSMLEPLMIVVFGGVIGVMVVALYLPMLSIFNNIK
jgi:type IV pilus assembly protein PilC